MGKAWYDRSSASRAIFLAADDALGFKLSQVCFDGPQHILDRTDIAQVAIYATSIACFAGLTQQGRIGNICAAAGLSLGEFTALHVAGAFDFATGLKLVHVRGKAMQQAAEAADGGMIALVGADDGQAIELCKRVLEQAGGDSAATVLVPANYNCPGQVVISGSEKACQMAQDLAPAMGLKATALKVAGAFHSPLMAPASKRLADELDQVTWQTLQIPVLSNVTALPHEAQDTAQIKDKLVEQLTQPVRWTGSMQWLVRHARGRYVELAPGKVLSGLMRRIDRKTRVLNYAEPPAPSTGDK